MKKGTSSNFSETTTILSHDAMRRFAPANVLLFVRFFSNGMIDEKRIKYSHIPMKTKSKFKKAKGNFHSMRDGL